MKLMKINSRKKKNMSKKLKNLKLNVQNFPEKLKKVIVEVLLNQITALNKKLKQDIYQNPDLVIKGVIIKSILILILI